MSPRGFNVEQVLMLSKNVLGLRSRAEGKRGQKHDMRDVLELDAPDEGQAGAHEGSEM